MILRIRAGFPVYGGYTLVREHETGIIFIKGALPEELVDIKIEEKKKTFLLQRLLR